MDIDLFSPIVRGGNTSIQELVYQALRTALLSGDVDAGQLLPPERRLCNRLEVSRVTLRKALERLGEEGFLESAPGRGWLAMTPVVEPPSALLSFSALAAIRNLRVSSKVLICVIREATLDEAEALSTAPGAAVLEIKRVRYIEEMPVAIGNSILSAKLVPGLESVDFSSNSLYAALEGYGIVPTTALYSVEARQATKEQANHLDMEEGKPVLVARQRTFDQNRAPIETGILVYRGDRYRFEAALRREVQEASIVNHGI